jgi:hypothetical protein
MMTPEARVWGVTGCLQEKSWAFACQAARDTYFFSGFRVQTSVSVFSRSAEECHSELNLAAEHWTRFYLRRLPAHNLGQKDAPMAWVGAPPSSLKPGHFFCELIERRAGLVVFSPVY